MAKKKKVWKSTALEESNLRPVDKIRTVLISVAKGNFCDEPAENLYDLLAGQFEKIEKLKSDAEILEMLAWFLNCSAYFDIPESDGELLDAVDDLFANVVVLFTEKAEACENREFLQDLMHDLLVNSAGEEARSSVFCCAQEYLSAEEADRVAEKVLSTVSAHDLENEDDIFSGLLDLAEAAKRPELYEKVAFLKDPNRSNGTLVNVANAYYVADDLSSANRLMDEVKNPEGDDEENFLDLKIGILFEEEKEKEALELAEKLYEKFPKEANLMRLCQVVSPSRKEELLDSHEKFRLGSNFSTFFVGVLAHLGEWDRISNYLDRFEKKIPNMETEERENLAKFLEGMKHPELAKKVRKG